MKRFIGTAILAGAPAFGSAAKAYPDAVVGRLLAERRPR
jgi:hypothetical protein